MTEGVTYGWVKASTALVEASGWNAARPVISYGKTAIPSLVTTIKTGASGAVERLSGVIDDVGNRLRGLNLAVDTGAISFGGKADEAANTETTTLFHHTDEAGMNGILDSGELNASLRSVNPSDARYGNGQYLSDVRPGTMSRAQLSRCFIGQPFQGSRFTNHVEINVDGLNVIQGRTGVFVVPGETLLDLTGRIASSGAT